MKKIDEQKHFLALMNLPGDYVLIDISKLDIANGFEPHTLMELDIFTMYFSAAEIIAAIKRANMASERYLNGSLVIQDNQKHNPIEVIDREYYDNFRIDLFLKEKLEDKNATNTIINKFAAIIRNVDLQQAFKTSLKNSDLDEVCDILFNLPYLQQRKFIVYLINWRNKDRELNIQELIRDKAA